MDDENEKKLTVYPLWPNPEEWLASCFKTIKQSFMSSADGRLRPSPVLRYASKDFYWNKSTNSSICDANTNQESCSRAWDKLNSAVMSKTSISTCGSNDFRCKHEVHENAVQARKENKLKATSTAGDRTHKDHFKEKRISNRKPREAVRNLVQHSMKLSIISSKACEIFNPSSTCIGSAALETLLLDTITHQIDAIDVALSAELSETCALLLQGLCNVSKAVYTLQVCNTPNMSSELENGEMQRITLIREAMKQVDTTSLETTRVHLKYKFLKLQLQALLATALKPGTSIFYTAMKDLHILTETLLKENPFLILSDLQWEDDNDSCRRLYWIILQEIKSKVDKYVRCPDGFESLFNCQEPRQFSKTNTEVLPPLPTKTSTTLFESRFRRSENQGRTPRANLKSDFKTTPEAHYNATTTSPSHHRQNINTDGSDCAAAAPGVRRRYRRPTDLLIDMTNHVLHLNNFKYAFICKRAGSISEVKLHKTSLDLDTLLSVPKHQIGVLDIVLTSELYDTGVLLIYGIYDTASTIEGVRKLSGRLPKKSTTKPNSAPQLGSSFFEAILLAIHLCQKNMERDYTKMHLKYCLIRLQLQGLLLTHCSIESDLFQEHLERLQRECKTTCKQLQQKWWTKYFSLNWDTALRGEEQVCNAYWTVMETNFVNCGLH